MTSSAARPVRRPSATTPPPDSGANIPSCRPPPFACPLNPLHGNPAAAFRFPTFSSPFSCLFYLPTVQNGRETSQTDGTPSRRRSWTYATAAASWHSHEPPFVESGRRLFLIGSGRHESVVECPARPYDGGATVRNEEQRVRSLALGGAHRAVWSDRVGGDRLTLMAGTGDRTEGRSGLELTIGGWRVQPDLGRVTRDDRVVHLEPRVMDVLV